MKIAIVGAGAMGSVFGGIMAENNGDVTLVDHWDEHITIIQSQGLIISGIGGCRTVPIKATTNPQELGIVDLVIIFSKAYDTSSAMQTASFLIGPNTVVLTFQNGIGNIEVIQETVLKENVLIGSTAWGAFMKGPGRVKHAGIGTNYIGAVYKEAGDKLQTVCKELDKLGLQVNVSANITGIVWTKLLANVGINALTGILRVNNGKLIECNYSEELLSQAVIEASAVAKEEGVELLCSDPVEYARDVCKGTASNRSSMLQDILTQRRTEIDYMNGQIVQKAKAYGIPAPVNSVLYNLIKSIENTNDINNN